jgi:hypothetical protein
MTWSYENTNLGTTTDSGRLNAVRLLVGDTSISKPQVQDEEILFSLAQEGNNVYFAASWIANTLSSKYARYVDTELDGQLSEKLSQLQKHYKDLSKDLEYQGKTSGATLGVHGGGISISTVGLAHLDTDRVKPRIRRDQFRYYENPSDYDGSD